MTRIEVIVPVYNNEKYIEKCVMSLINQTFEDLKVIVVNDGSTDKTETIVRSIMKKYPDRIRYFHKENGGIAHTRNFALDKVEAEYFGFLDSDDYVDSSMYEKMYQRIITEDSDVCMCDFYWEYPDNSSIATDGPYTDKHHLLSEMFATLWNKLYRTEWVKNTRIRFPDGLHYEDASFLYRLASQMDRVAYLNEALVHYVQREGSITHTFKVNVKDMMVVFEGIRDYYENNGLMEEFKDEVEYLFIRFFLGNSYLRAVRIIDDKLRKSTLDMSWTFLNSNFPEWKNNPYLKKGGRKNMYFRHLNESLYYFNSHVFRILYKLGIMK